MGTSKQRSIAEIPGISQSAVVQLNRAGINTIHDLLTADYEQVAVLMDCFDDAAKVIKEAKRMVDIDAKAEAAPRAEGRAGHGRTRASSAAARAPQDPFGYPAFTPSSPRAARVLMNPSPAASARIGGANTSSAADQEPSPTMAGESPVAMAITMGLLVAAPTGEPARTTMARRLGVAARLMASPGDDAEAVAGVLIEPVEAGAIPMDRVIKAFGADVAKVLDEAMAIRAVPVSPSGRLPQYYADMAKRASTPSRRVCAAYQIWWLDQPAAQAPGASTWYAKLIAEALEAGEPNTLVAALSDRMRKRAA